MSRKITSDSALTLVELILAIAVSGIAGVLLLSIFAQNNTVFYNQQVKTSQNLNLNVAYTRINKDIKMASAIVSSYTSGTTVYTTSINTCVLKIPAINSSGNTLDNVFDYYIITRDSQNPKLLKELIFPDPLSSRKQSSLILSKDVSSLQFLYLDSNNTQVNPTVAATINFVINVATFVNNKNQQSSASGQTSLRNN